ncbi:TIGR02808 family protein [Shewanella sp. GXUN23E]
MSTLESVIWHVLGYCAIPFIILAGFTAVAALSVWILSLSADKTGKS